MPQKMLHTGFISKRFSKATASTLTKRPKQYYLSRRNILNEIDMIRHTLDFNEIMTPSAFDGFAEKVPS
jgi:hypothetical protein